MGSNFQPFDQKSDALPIELSRATPRVQSYIFHYLLLTKSSCFFFYKALINLNRLLSG